MLMDEAAEQSVLGAFLLDGRDVTGVGAELMSSFFADVRNSLIFQAIRDLWAAGEATDEVTVAARLKGKGMIGQAGGESYVARLTECTPSSANVRNYANVVKDLARRRRVYTVCEEHMNMARGEGVETEELEKSVAAAAVDVVADGGREDCLVGQELAQSFMRDIDARQAGLSGNFRMGWAAIDAIVDPISPGEFWIVAGRPSMGKTSLAVGLALNALQRGTGVMFASLEMTADALAGRFIARRARVPMGDMRREGGLNAGQMRRVTEACAWMSEQPMTVFTRPAATVSQIEAAVQKARTKHNVGVVLVDYLQLMGGKEHASREREVAQLSRGLVALAKRCNVVVIALSQLSRGVEQRNDKRPMLADLRDSGSIEQDADGVIFAYRHEYYEPGVDEGVFEAIVRKQRNGKVGTAKLHWVADWAAIQDIA